LEKYQICRAALDAPSKRVYRSLDPSTCHHRLLFALVKTASHSRSFGRCQKGTYRSATGKCIQAVVQWIRRLVVDGDIESSNHDQQLLDMMPKWIRRSAVIGVPSNEDIARIIIHAIDRAKGAVDDSDLSKALGEWFQVVGNRLLTSYGVLQIRARRLRRCFRVNRIPILPADASHAVEGEKVCSSNRRLVTREGLGDVISGCSPWPFQSI
jgi:hypothetical protein